MQLHSGPIIHVTNVAKLLVSMALTAICDATDSEDPHMTALLLLACCLHD